MLKLMKYEFRKQLFSKIVLLVLGGLCQAGFFIGIMIKSERWIAISSGLFFVFMIIGLFFVFLETITTYSSDLNNKWSYMLFLTPTTSYEIVGAKLLTAMIQTFVFGFVCFGAIVMDIIAALGRFSDLNDIKELIMMMTEQGLNITMNYSMFINILLTVLLSSLLFVSMAYFSITLSSTFLANKRYKGIVSFAIFIIINMALSWVSARIPGIASGVEEFNSVIRNLPLYLYYIVTTGIIYFGTAFMLEKKVSV